MTNDMPTTAPTASPEVTYRQAIRDALDEEMARDDTVFLLGEDIGFYGGAFRVTEGLAQKYGDARVLDTPISESAIVGIAIGAALMGLRPVAEMQFADFIACAFDQIVNEAATATYRYGGKVGLPLVIRAPSGAGVHGGLFHSQSPEAWFTRVPGLKVVLPATPYDAKGLLKSAIRDNNPVLYFEHKYLYNKVREVLPKEEYLVPLGQAAVRQEGGDLTIITYSAMVHQALAAAKELAKEDISCEVIDLRTLAPLDKQTIFASVRKTSKVLVLHEDSRTGGFGGEIAALIAEEAFEDLDAPIMRVAAIDTHVPFSPPMERFYLPNVTDIAQAARKLHAY